MIFHSNRLVGLLFIICVSHTILLGTAREIDFPDYFQFGSATSSYQTEGGWDADGKGPSIWDTFTHDHPEMISDESNGDVAVNSYQLYKEDVVALKGISAQFYRFSISWSRVLSKGDITTRNQAGIDYYHKLIDELKANGIEPMITIYHWDLPQTMQDLGGFTNPYIVKYFEQYADLLFSEYGSKVKLWITLDEPKSYCEQGYGTGAWAPGIKLHGVGDYYCAHYSILAHARMYHLYKNKYFTAQGGKIGITLNTDFYFPLSPDDSDEVASAERALQFSFGRFAHPIVSKEGDYPQMVRERIDANSKEQGYTRSRLPKFTSDEIEYVRGTSDFLGINYFTSLFTMDAKVSNNFEKPSVQHDTYVDAYHNPTYPLDGTIYNNPEGLYNLLKWIRDNYDNIEVLITENGTTDQFGLDDNFRLNYLKGHLAAVSDAIKENCNVTAHATWSLLDNFVWSNGYSRKFGLYGVNENFERIPKKSVAFLREVIENRHFEFND